MRRFSADIRRGVSAVESATILSALLTGLGLGMYYLGVDPRELLATATRPTPAADAEPIEATPAIAVVEPANVDPAMAEIAKLRAEVDRLRDAKAQRANGAPQSNSANQASPQPPGPTLSQHEIVGRRTLAYWNQMNAVMAHEEKMRSVPAGGLTAANAGDFIRRRGQAGAFAVAELGRLDTQLVDPQVVALCGEIAAWYRQGTQLNDKADYLLNDASEQQRRGGAGKTWSGAEKSHGASVAVINRRGNQLRAELSQKYGREFPPLK